MVCSEPEMCSVWRWESILLPFPIFPPFGFSLSALLGKREKGENEPGLEECVTFVTRKHSILTAKLTGAKVWAEPIVWDAESVLHPRPGPGMHCTGMEMEIALQSTDLPGNGDLLGIRVAEPQEWLG